MRQVRQGEAGSDLRAFPQTPQRAEARRAQGSWGQFIPLTTVTACRLERRIIYFCVLGLCLWRDLSPVLSTEQCRSMWLVQSKATLSPRMGWRCENRPALQTLLLLRLCSPWLAPAQCLLPCRRAGEGDAGWGCSMPQGRGAPSREQGGCWSQPSRVVTSMRHSQQKVYHCQQWGWSPCGLVEPLLGQKEVAATVRAEGGGTGFSADIQSSREYESNAEPAYPHRQCCQPHLEQLVIRVGCG